MNFVSSLFYPASSALPTNATAPESANEVPIDLISQTAKSGSALPSATPQGNESAQPVSPNQQSSTAPGQTPSLPLSSNQTSLHSQGPLVTPLNPHATLAAPVVPTTRSVEDKVTGLQALSEKSKENPDDVLGSSVIPKLMQHIQSERHNMEILNVSLEILLDVTTVPSQEKESVAKQPAALMNTQILLQNASNITAVLNLLEIRDFYVRFRVIKLLGNLLANKPQLFQETIINIPHGLSRILDALSDTRDVIQTETLNLMTALTQTNPEIQKIVAFNGIFEKLFDMIKKEGGIDSGILVQDSLSIMVNVVKNNHITQNYFKEMKYFPKVLNLVDQHLKPSDLNASMALNLGVIFDIITSLTSHASAISSHIQAKLKETNFIYRVMEFGFGSTRFDKLRVQALICLASSIRGFSQSQGALASCNIKIEPSEPTTVLYKLFETLYSPISAEEKRAVLFVIESYFYENDESLASFVASIFATPEQGINSYTDASSLVLDNLLQTENMQSIWVSSAVLQIFVALNPAIKDILVGATVPLEYAISDSPESSKLDSFIEAIASNYFDVSNVDVVEMDKVIGQIGTLSLLSALLYESPKAVSVLSRDPNYILKILNESTPPEGHDNQASELVEESSDLSHNALISGLCCLVIASCVQFNGSDETSDATKESILGLIDTQIGFEDFLAKLQALQTNPLFATKEADDSEPNLPSFDTFPQLFVKESLALIESSSELISSYLRERPITQRSRGFVLPVSESSAAHVGGELSAEKDREIFRLKGEILQLKALLGNTPQERIPELHEGPHTDPINHANFNGMQHNHTDHVAEDNHQNAHFAQEINTLVESNKQLLGELTEARDTVNQLRKQIADQAREDIELRQMYFKLDQQNQELRNEIVLLRNRLEKKTNEYETLANEQTDLLAFLSDQKEELDLLRSLAPIEKHE